MPSKHVGSVEKGEPSGTALLPAPPTATDAKSSELSQARRQLVKPPREKPVRCNRFGSALNTFVNVCVMARSFASVPTFHELPG